MVFITAEAGINANGDLQRALDMIEAAKSAGADACKFQMYDADTLQPPGDLHDILKSCQFAQDQHASLKEHCDKVGIQYLCTPFDLDSLAYLTDTLGLTTIKLASGFLSNELMLEAAAKAGTVILSTGASEIQECRAAVRYIRSLKESAGIIVLHCVSAYPAPFDQINLKAISTLRDELRCTVGLSDHSEGIAIPIAASAMGACMIEKHFTLDKSLPGPDQSASLNPDELKAMVDGIRAVEQAMGDGVKKIVASEQPAIQMFQVRADFKAQLARQAQADTPA